MELQIGAAGVCWAQGESGGAELTRAEPEAEQPAPGAEAEEVAKGPKGYPLVTNVFFDTDIRQALSDVAAQTGAIIIPDESVMGFVTLDLQDVPLERALELILMPGGFLYAEVEAGVYLVTRPDRAQLPQSRSHRNCGTGLH